MSGGGSDVGKAASQAQADSSRELFESSRPARDSFLKQVMAALQGKPGQIPLINQATAGADYGRERAIENTTKMAGKLGFNQDTTRSISAPLDVKGKQAGTDVREQLLKQFAAYGPGLAIQPAQLAQSGLAGAVQRSQANAAAKKASDNQAAASGGAAAAAIAAALIIAYSRAELKDDIEHLTPMAVDTIADIALELPLTTFRYKDKEHTHLGLIVQDVEGKPFLVPPSGEGIDLYSLATMAIAAVQTQARTIAALEKRIVELENG